MVAIIYGKKGEENFKFSEGCDFCLELPASRKNDEIRILQLTDMQIIDATKRRTPDRLCAEEIVAWGSEAIKGNCYDHISSVVSQTNPDLIFISGDIIYGQFDDDGTVLRNFIDFMDSFEIPWTIVFGNHDNESAIGVDAQCEMYTNAKYCMFKRGTVTGNGNFTIGISVDGELKRVMYMLDSHGCLRGHSLCADQLDYMVKKAGTLKEIYGILPDGFTVFHIPLDYYKRIAYKKGYANDEKDYFNIGVDVKAKDDDFGFDYELCCYIEIDDETVEKYLADTNTKGVFMGHNHSSCASIKYNGVKWTYGLKTGQYDYHTPGMMGGTLVTVNHKNDDFKVQHIQALVKLSPFPASSPSYKDLFAK